MSNDIVITGLGVVAANGIGKTNFWNALNYGISAISAIDSFCTDKFPVNIGAEIKNFKPENYLGPKGLRNLDRSALLLLTSAKQTIEDAGLEINDSNTDSFGVCTGTTFSHLWSIIEFDKEVSDGGLNAANPALFPLNVMNAASSHVSIRFNIQGFNTTISTGYTSGMEALKYSLDAIETGKADTIISAGVESLISPVFFGFHKLGYLAGIKGKPLCCPFDKRRNGPVLGEAAVSFCVERETEAKKRKVNIYAGIKSVSCFFDGYKMGKIHPEGNGLEAAIRKALDDSGINSSEIDYISSCANSSVDMDKIEVKVLKKVFGSRLKSIPVSSIKSMVGETFSASAGLQISSVIGAMVNGIIPPTINYKEKDSECDIDCVPNKSQEKEVKTALITSFGPGGYNSACVLEKYK